MSSNRIRIYFEGTEFELNFEYYFLFLYYILSSKVHILDDYPKVLDCLGISSLKV